jgi:hypothetical protein
MHDQAAMVSANQMADKYRDMLSKMGVDSSLFGQDKTIEQTMKGLDLVTYQTTSSIQAKYKMMTAGVSSSLIDASNQTKLNTTSMINSWTAATDNYNTMTTGITNDLGNVSNQTKINTDSMIGSWSTATDNYSLMTNGINKNLGDVSNLTAMSTGQMANSWSAATNKTIGTSMALRNMMIEVFQSIENIVKEVAMGMDNVLANAFHNIVNNAQSAVSQVMSLVNQMNAAIASIAGSGINVSSSISHSSSSSMSLAGMPMLAPMAPAMSRGSGGITNHITVHANGNVTESNERLGDIVSRALLDKMKGQGKLG